MPTPQERLDIFITDYRLPITDYRLPKLTMSQIYYIIRSRTDGRYVTARPDTSSNAEAGGYLLMFREDFEALSYLNKWASDVANRFAVESIPSSQVKNLLKRWGFIGVGVVVDPLVPSVEFLIQD